MENKEEIKNCSCGCYFGLTAKKLESETSPKARALDNIFQDSDVKNYFAGERKSWNFYEVADHCYDLAKDTYQDGNVTVLVLDELQRKHFYTRKKVGKEELETFNSIKDALKNLDTKSILMFDFAVDDLFYTERDIYCKHKDVSQELIDRISNYLQIEENKEKCRNYIEETLAGAEYHVPTFELEDYAEQSFLIHFKDYINKLYKSKQPGDKPKILNIYQTLEENEKVKELKKAMIDSYFSIDPDKADIAIYFPEYNIFIEIASLSHHMSNNNRSRNMKKISGLLGSRSMLGNLAEVMHGNMLTHINLLIKPKEWKLREVSKQIQSIVNCKNCIRFIVEHEHLNWKFEEFLKPHKKLDCSESLKIEKMLIGMHHFYMISNSNHSKPMPKSIITNQYIDANTNTELQFSKSLLSCKIGCNLKLGADGEVDKHPLDEESTQIFDDQIGDFQGSGDSYESDAKIGEIFKERDRTYYVDELDSVVAIPSHFSHPKHPCIIKQLDKPQIKIFDENKHLEEELHFAFCSTLKANRIPGLIIQGFQTYSLIRIQTDKAQKQRKNYNLYVSLNKHEEEIKELINFEELSMTELEDIKQWHIKIFTGENKPDWTEIKNESGNDKFRLRMIKEFKKNIVNQKKCIEAVYNLKTNEEIESFYNYHHYKFQLQEFQRECDSIVILPTSKTVLSIEVKGGETWSKVKSSSKQTGKRKTVFMKVFSSQFSGNWTFVQASFCPNLEDKEKEKMCDYCKQFFINSSMVKDLSPWINKILNMKKNFTKEEYKEDYVYIRKTMIGSEALENIGNLRTYRIQTEKAITSENHGITGECHDGLELDSYENKEVYIMFTPDQLDVFKKSTGKLCILEGDYGTGKTYILKAKMRYIAKGVYPKKVLYISLTGAIEALNIKDKLNAWKSIKIMDFIAKQDFMDLNVKCIGTAELVEKYGHVDEKTTISMLVDHYIKDSDFQAVFIDEVPLIFYDKFVPFDLKTDITVWLALRRHEYSKNTQSKVVKEFQKWKNKLETEDGAQFFELWLYIQFSI